VERSEGKKAEARSEGAATKKGYATREQFAEGDRKKKVRRKGGGGKKVGSSEWGRRRWVRDFNTAGTLPGRCGGRQEPGGKGRSKKEGKTGEISRKSIERRALWL